MAVAFITGLSAGVQAMAARRVGEGLSSETAIPLNGGLLLAIVLSVPLSVLLILNADRLFPLLVDDPEVVALGIPYFRARLFAMVAVGINYSFRGYWNGVSLSRVYLQTLLILAIFIHDPLTLELAVFPMRLIAATMAFDTVGTVLMNALLGAGDSRRVMIVSVFLQWGLFLPLAFLLGPTLGFGMTGVWMAQVVYRLLQTISFIALWRHGKWALIRL